MATVYLAYDLRIDPVTVDTATYQNPCSYPVGIAAVVVNGAIALRQGERRTGRAVRPA